MIKLVAALRKKEGLSFEAFQDYYENHHARLISNVPTAARYLRRYIKECWDETGRLVEPQFHVLTEVWFETQTGLDAALARLRDPELAKVYRADESNMLDMTMLRTFIVDERETPLGASSAGPGDGTSDPRGAVQSQHQSLSGYDPFAEPRNFHDEVYARIERVQSQGVFFSPSLQAWVAATHPTCVTTFSSKDLSNEAALLPEIAAQMPPRIRTFATMFLPSTEGPQHLVPRGIVQKILGPAFFKSLRPRIGAIIDEELDRFAHRSEMDLIPEFAFSVPIRVIAHMLGVADDRRGDFARWGASVLATLDARNCTPERMRELEVDVQEMVDFFESEIQRRRHRPGEDLISKLIATDELSFDQQWVMLASVLIAGHETTTGAIGSGVRQLLIHRDQFKRIVEDPSLAVTAVDEILRHDSPADIPTPRIGVRDVQVGPVVVKRNERIFPWIQAANMDPAVFKDPHTFDVGRRPNPHLAFGNDRHHCLGSMLGRAEIEIAVAKIAARFPNLEGDVEPANWGPNFANRTLKSLKVRANN